MSSSRCSDLALALLVALVLAAGAAGAVTVSEGSAPAEAKVGSTVSATFTLTELYQNPSYETWTLQGETALENATWTVTTFNAAGSQINQESYDGTQFGHEVSLDNDVLEVRLKVTGTAPEIGNLSYDPEERFLFAELRLTREGGAGSVIETYETHHYTEESKEAREAIESAQAAIDEAGGNEEAQSTVENAISAYEVGNFGNAVDLANRAEDTATSASARSRQLRLALYAGAGVFALLLVVGGVFWYRANRTASKL